MWRWTMRIVVGTGRVPCRCRTLRRHVSMACNSKGACGNSPSRTSRRHRRTPAASVVHRGRRACRHPGYGTRRLELLTGASSNLMLLGSRVSAPTTGQVRATAIPARRRGQHAALRASCPNSWPAAGLTDRWCSSEPPSRVSTSGCSLPITLSGPQASCSWMPPTKTRHMRCRGWRDLFPCCRRPASSDCSAYRSARDSSCWLPRYANSRRRRVSAQLDTRRRLTRLFMFERARRKSEVRAASSPSLSSSSPVAGEPTRIGESCNAIRPRCQSEDV